MVVKECFEHGYFRAETCPVCDSEGKMLMNGRELESLGRTLAGILRHFPERYGLLMDKNGWVDLKSVVDSIRERKKRFFGRWLREHHIVALVDTDEKGRYQVNEGKIRATYGHSIEIELDFPEGDVPEYLYYPASREEAEILLETGLTPGDRKMVHLSIDYESAMIAGSYRLDSPVILEIHAKDAVENGVKIMKAAKTVFLAKEIPPDFLGVCEKNPDSGSEEE